MPWSRCASGRNGSCRAPSSATAPIGPFPWEEMWHWYGEAERQINIAGPIRYPWGPKRPRYPYRAHELNSAGKLLAQGCEAIGIDWTETPLATISAPHRGKEGSSPPCVYRGFCRFGCSTNAKRSALTVWIPRASKRRGGDPRPRHGWSDRNGARTGARQAYIIIARASGASSGHAMSIVAGYAVETPRLAAELSDQPLSPTVWPTVLA